MKFSDIFGNPKEVDSSEARAIAEVVADSVGAGSGAPGDWDGEIDFKDLKCEDDDDPKGRMIDILQEFINAAVYFLLNLESENTPRRAMWRALMHEVMRSAPDWGVTAMVAYDMTGDDLDPETARLQLEAMAQQLGKEVDDPQLKVFFDNYVFVGTRHNVGEIEDETKRGAIATLMQQIITQELGRVLQEMAPPPESKIVGLDGSPAKLPQEKAPAADAPIDQ